MKVFLWFVSLVSAFYFNTAYSTQQKSTCVPPKLIKPIENYTIVAGNIGMIAAAPSFSGKHLRFAVQAKPTNLQNKVNINAKSGVLQIKAETRDSFDIQVIAKNTCGQANTTFNMQIDEEE